MSDTATKADANPHHERLRLAALDAAGGEAGVRAKCSAGVPAKSCRTWGERIRVYQRAVGMGGGNDYCVAFVWWCFDRAAKGQKETNPLPRMSGAGQLLDLAKRRDCLVFPPKPGDVFVLSKPGKNGTPVPDHVGFVESASLDEKKALATLKTVEGNTWVKDFDWGVHERSRDPKKAVYSFARF